MELLGSSYTFENYSLETGVDITNTEDIRSRIVQNNASWMFHFAAYTNVQEAEKQRKQGRNSISWQVNVSATENIVNACKESGKHVLYIDTDYAFDGTKKKYTESDTPNPQGWYATTKSEGAKRVLAYDKGLVVRISNPYRANPQGKTDFVHKMLERLKKGEKLTAATDQLFVPTFIDDFASALQTLISVEAAGIYHVAASEAISPFDAAQTVAAVYGYDKKQIQSTSFTSYFAGQAMVPQYAVLQCGKIEKLGVRMHAFDQGVQAVYAQEQQQHG